MLKAEEKGRQEGSYRSLPEKNWCLSGFTTQQPPSGHEKDKSSFVNPRKPPSVEPKCISRAHQTKKHVSRSFCTLKSRAMGDGECPGSCGHRHQWQRQRRRRRLGSRSAVDLTVPLAVIFIAFAAAASAAAGSPGGTHAGAKYHSQFAVLVPHGREAADRLAARHGFANMGQIGDLENYYLLERNDERRGKREARPDADAARMLADEPEVEWFEQQKERRRVKRDGHKIASRGRLEQVGAGRLAWEEAGGEGDDYTYGADHTYGADQLISLYGAGLPPADPSMAPCLRLSIHACTSKDLHSI